MDNRKQNHWEIREYTESDWPQVWPIIQSVIVAQDTFTYEPSMTTAQSRAIWVERPPGLTVVALADGRVLGTAKMGPNRPGPGSHISTASFLVREDSRGRGIGTALLRFALDWAHNRGYKGMQFNAVVASNRSAIEPYKRHGFTIVGTVPGAFTHPVFGYVDLHLMYCEF